MTKMCNPAGHELSVRGIKTFEACVGSMQSHCWLRHCQNMPALVSDDITNVYESSMERLGTVISDRDSNRIISRIQPMQN